jgi:signal transduction histidine kinase
MAELVDDLLAFARTSSQRLAKSEIDISTLAQEEIERIQLEENYAQEVEFVVAPGLIARADAQLARVVLHNLVDNACKYGTPDRGLRVELGTDGPSVFFVRDNGRGFDLKYAELIFKPFERLHSDSSIPGSGLGLANVRRIVTRHGGSIWAESEPGTGSTFYFTFEARSPARGASPPDPAVHA